MYRFYIRDYLGMAYTSIGNVLVIKPGILQDQSSLEKYVDYTFFL